MIKKKNKCACGCDGDIKHGNRFINGHNKSTLGRLSKFKGITNKERFGTERAKEISKKIKLSKLGEKNPAKRPEVKKKISENRKGKLTGDKNPNYWLDKKNPNQSNRMKINNPSFRPEVKKQARIRQLTIFQERGDVKIGRNEERILNEIEQIINKKISRQYSIIGYSVDGYIPELNLVIEIDEGHHYKPDGCLKEGDIKRQGLIVDKLGCNFIRIKDNITLKKLFVKLKEN